MREKPRAPAKAPARRTKTKSQEKPQAKEPDKAKYKNVKSRLHKSIEASRNKATAKYVNPERDRDVAL